MADRGLMVHDWWIWVDDMQIFEISTPLVPWRIAMASFGLLVRLIGKP